jgi:hypothetical protein
VNPTLARRRTFGRGSPVLENWLGHSEGFELTSPGGAHQGVVQEVLTDELGYPRALIVRSGVLQRARVMNVNAVEAVVPADGTITVRGTRRKRNWPRITLLRRGPGRGMAAAVARPAERTARIMWMSAVLALASLASAAGWTARRLRTDVPALAGQAGRAVGSAAAWARPHARTLARLAAAAAVTLGLFVLALAQVLAIAVAAYARFVGQEWTRLRSRATSGRVKPKPPR